MFATDCVHVESVTQTPSKNFPCGLEKTVKLNFESSDSRDTFLSQLNNQLSESVRFISQKE
jgi:hypothetical protein